MWPVRNSAAQEEASCELVNKAFSVFAASPQGEYHYLRSSGINYIVIGASVPGAKKVVTTVLVHNKHYKT